MKPPRSHELLLTNESRGKFYHIYSLKINSLYYANRGERRAGLESDRKEIVVKTIDEGDQ